MDRQEYAPPPSLCRSLFRDRPGAGPLRATVAAAAPVSILRFRIDDSFGWLRDNWRSSRTPDPRSPESHMQDLPSPAGGWAQAQVTVLKSLFVLLRSPQPNTNTLCLN